MLPFKVCQPTGCPPLNGKRMGAEQLASMGMKMQRSSDGRGRRNPERERLPRRAGKGGPMEARVAGMK